MTEIRLVVLGSGGVGKSATILRLLTGKFVDAYDPTIEDSYRKQITIDNESQLLSILDTAGQDEYSKNLIQWCNWGEAFLVMYSITSRLSFINMKQNTLRKLLEVKGDKSFAMVICGNKCEEVTGRIVSKEEGQSTAEHYKSPFYEISAKEGTRIDDAFEALVREVRSKREGGGANANMAPISKTPRETRTKKKEHRRSAELPSPSKRKTSTPRRRKCTSPDHDTFRSKKNCTLF